MGKTAVWYLIQQMAATQRYLARKYRFYYVDERTPQGKALTSISGPGHADFFLELSESKEQRPILATFVTGKGYVPFPASQRTALPSITVEQAVDFSYGRK
jgi:hypothetical protein